MKLYDIFASAAGKVADKILDIPVVQSIMKETDKDLFDYGVIVASCWGIVATTRGHAIIPEGPMLISMISALAAIPTSCVGIWTSINSLSERDFRNSHSGPK